MDLIKSIQAYAKTIPADFKEKKGSCDLSFTVAERKGFLSKQKLTYQAKFRIDEQEKTVHFAEILKRLLLVWTPVRVIKLQATAPAKAVSKIRSLNSSLSSLERNTTINLILKQCALRSKIWLKKPGLIFNIKLHLKGCETNSPDSR